MGDKMGQEKKGLCCAQFLDVFVLVVPVGYLRGVFGNPWAIRIYIIGRGTRIRGKYSEMVSIPSVVGTMGKDEIAQGAFKEKSTGNQG